MAHAKNKNKEKEEKQGSQWQRTCHVIMQISKCCWHTSLISALGKQAGRSLWVQGQPGLHREFRDSSWGHMVRTSVKTKQGGGGEGMIWVLEVSSRIKWDNMCKMLTRGDTRESWWLRTVSAFAEDSLRFGSQHPHGSRGSNTLSWYLGAPTCMRSIHIHARGQNTWYT